MGSLVSKKVARRGRAAIVVAGIAALLLVAAAVAVALGVEGADATHRTSATRVPQPLLAEQMSVLEGGGLSPAQAGRELEVQTAIDEAELVAGLESALRGAFGGVWLEPASATLHVAVTSAAGQRTAEEVAEQAGLAAHLVVTRVRSSWSELIAAREQWDRRHADLLSRGEAVTSLLPQSNSVKVRLSAAVGPSEQSALEEEAAASPVGVTLLATSGPDFRLEPDVKRCRGFEAFKAFCNSPIAAGVSIQNVAVPCTAGPAVIKKPLEDDTTETFILTAGHCAPNAEEPFDSFDKGEKEEFVGRAVAALTAANDQVDVGVVKVENGFWMNAGLAPVSPAVTYWEAAESDPLPVVGQQKPVINHTSCYSGQTTGTGCGRIEEVGITSEGLKETVEVRELTEVPEGGDSGGPWFAKVTGGVKVEGTHVSHAGNFAFFAPLEHSFKRLEANAGSEQAYELLTTANETRPTCPMPDDVNCFEPESYPATITGTQAEINRFGFESGKVECGSSTYSGLLTEASETIELSPTFSSCDVFGLPFATIDVNGCKYKFVATSTTEVDEYKGTVDLICPSGKSIVITSACGCKVTIHGQSALGTVEYSDTTGASPVDINVNLALTGIEYTEDAFCQHQGTHNNGTYDGDVTLKADTAGGSAQRFWIAGLKS